MKKVIKILLLSLIVFPISLLAHEGHVHTGTFTENLVHFLITKFYLYIPAAIGIYFLLKHKRSLKKEDN
ncbi:MAG: hypothetical protein H6610_08590 [Ignavibacteriales bacterium]|nr:hypothetical protein [Ignavibacteriales bacterium]MCB9219499.1 hypothetical protein [Ignavibacteriales bacterium]